MIGDAVAHAADGIADRVSDRLASAGLKIGALIGMGLAIAAAITCAAIAGFWWLQPQFGTVQSALITAAGFVALAVALLLISKFGASSATKGVLDVEPMQIVEDEAEETVDTMGATKFVLTAAGIGALLAMRLSSTSDTNTRGSAGPSLLSLISPAITLYAAVQSAKNASPTPASQSTPTANSDARPVDTTDYPRAA